MLYFKCSLLDGIKLHNAELEENSFSSSVPNFLLRLSSPIKILNFLPLTLVLRHDALPQSLPLDPGGTTSLIKIDPHKDEELEVTVSFGPTNFNNFENFNLELQISNYRGGDWQGLLKIPVERKEASKTLLLEQIDSNRKTKLEVSLYVVREVTTSVYIYAPYWIVNKTGLPIQIKVREYK